MEPFRYPESPLVRRHGPRGHATYESYRPWLRDEFSFRCAYCLAREQWGRLRGTYDLDHYVAIAGDPSGELKYDNLLYACRACNAVKSHRQVPDPCLVLIDGDVVVQPNGRMIGRSIGAKRLIRLIGLNSPEAVEFRRLWIEILDLAQRYDPNLVVRIIGYPDDLPDLSRLRPPGGNSRPEGIAPSHFARRERTELSETY